MVKKQLFPVTLLFIPTKNSDSHFFTKITFQFIKPTYIPSFNNAQAVTHLLFKFQKNYLPYKKHRLNKTETQTNQ